MKYRLFFSMLLLWWQGVIPAENLDSFEKGFSPGEKTSKPTKTTVYEFNFGSDDDNESLSEALVDLGALLVLGGLAAGRVYAEEVADLREDGDPVLTVFQINAGYQWIEAEDNDASLSGWRTGLSWRF